MIANKNGSTPNLEGLAAEARRLFEKLYSPASNVSLMIRTLHEIQNILQCTFVGAADFDLIRNRIENAKRYLRSGETGAAKYEIRLLLGSELCLPLNRLPPRIVSIPLQSRK